MIASRRDASRVIPCTRDEAPRCGDWSPGLLDTGRGPSVCTLPARHEDGHFDSDTFTGWSRQPRMTTKVLA
jgi:hypothetical protein